MRRIVAPPMHKHLIHTLLAAMHHNPLYLIAQFAIAALQRGLIKDLQGASIGVLVCGAGIDGLSPAGQD